MPSLALAPRGRNVKPRNVNEVCSIASAPFAVLAVHDPGLVGMQPQPDLDHPVLQRGQHLAGLALADAVDDRVIDIAFEADPRELPSHPRIKRIVQEQICQHGRDRRPLRGTPVSLLQGAVGQLHRGLQPPPHIQHHPRQIGVGPHRLEHQIPRKRCRKTSGCPNQSPSRFSNSVAGIRPPRPTPSGPAGNRRSRRERSARPSPRSSIGHHRLRDPVSHRGDGCFILSFLQSLVGIFGSDVVVLNDV